MEDYHTETMKDDPLWGTKYEEFVQEYANCYHVAVHYTEL